MVNVDLPTPVGANITPISPFAKPPLSNLSIPGIPNGIGCLKSSSSTVSRLEKTSFVPVSFSDVD